MTARLLGTNIQENMTWGAHLETGEDALFPETRKRLGVLKYLGRTIPKGSRKLLTEGLVISKLRYMISQWGATTDRNLRNAQTLMNDSARFVLGTRGRRTGTMALMKECGWLTVREITEHSTLLLAWKTLRLNSPRSMSDKFQREKDDYITCSAPRILHSTDGFRWRAVQLWNSLPQDLRACSSYPSFKNQTKRWLIDRRDDQEPG